MIADDYMREMIGRAKGYSVVILRGTPKLADPAAQAIVWEHARRNFQPSGRWRPPHRLPRWRRE